MNRSRNSVSEHRVEGGKSGERTLTYCSLLVTNYSAHCLRSFTRRMPCGARNQYGNYFAILLTYCNADVTEHRKIMQSAV